MRRNGTSVILCVLFALLVSLIGLPGLGRADEGAAAAVANDGLVEQEAQDLADIEEYVDAQDEQAEAQDGAADVQDEEAVAQDEQAAELLEGESQASENEQADEEDAKTELAPMAETGGKAEAEQMLSALSGPTVIYKTHVQNEGWQDWKADGGRAGTSGKALRLEALHIAVKVDGVTGGVAYRTHVQNVGWQDWVYDGDMSGTSGRALRLEGIEIKLTGELANKYVVEYRVHVQNDGWQDWKADGALAGTTGRGLRLEAIEIRLERKGTQELEDVPGANVIYNAHVQNIGWQVTKSDGEMAGTAGKAMRVEALHVKLGDGISGGITYQAHVQNVGWQDWVSDGALTGTQGRGLRVEALRIKLTGEAEKDYNVWYRVHAQDYGWLGWAKNGELSGTVGKGKRLEGVEIQVLPVNASAPGSTERHQIYQSLIYLDAGHGKSGGVYDSGAAGSGYTEATETKELVGKVAQYARDNYGLNIYVNIDCDVPYSKRQEHAKSVGATSFVSIHFNAAEGSATGSESYIYRAYGQYQGLAAPGSDTLQRLMHKRLVDALGLKDRGMKSEAFAVTNGKTTGIPATLLEVCFITNPNDMKVYKAREDEVARALAAGLNDIYHAGY